MYAGGQRISNQTCATWGSRSIDVLPVDPLNLSFCRLRIFASIGSHATDNRCAVRRTYLDLDLTYKGLNGQGPHLCFLPLISNRFD